MIAEGLFAPEGAEPTARPRRPWVTGPIIVGLAHFVVALVNIELTTWSTGLATVWAANALVLAALLIVPTAQWLPYIASVWIAGFLANVLAGYPVFASAPFAAINIAEALLAATLTRRWIGGPPQLERPLDLMKFITSAVAAATMSASLSAPFMAAASEQDIGRSWLSWFASDILGLLLVTPILLIAFAIWSRRRSFLQGRSTAEAAALFGMVTMFSVFVFMQAQWPLLFLLLPPVVLTTFRLRSAGASVAIVIIAIVGSYFTTIGSGPIALMAGDLADRLYFFQFFLAVAFLPALPVASVLDERDALAAVAERHAATDELTGTASRRMFLARLGQEIDKAAETGSPLSVALFDVDHFKSVNDRFGHDVGDDVLRRLGALATNSVGKRGIVGRLGGEEFAILFPGVGIEAASRICEKLRATCSAASGFDTSVNPVTVSIGVAAATPGASTNAVLKDADAAMYAAKAAGRNCIHIAA